MSNYSFILQFCVMHLFYLLCRNQTLSSNIMPLILNQNRGKKQTYSIRSLWIVFPEVENKQHLPPLHISLWKFGLSHLHSACQTVHCFVITHHRVSLGKVRGVLVYYHIYLHNKEKLVLLHPCSASHILLSVLDNNNKNGTQLLVGASSGTYSSDVASHYSGFCFPHEKQESLMYRTWCFLSWLLMFLKRRF